MRITPGLTSLDLRVAESTANIHRTVMTAPLRHPSARPAVVVDAWAKPLFDPATRSYVGRPRRPQPGTLPDPLGRARVVAAQPLDTGLPVQLQPPRVIVDPWGFRLVTPAGRFKGALIGDRGGVRVNRLLAARHAADTRRL